MTKALALDDSLAEAHASLAYLKMRQEWDWATGERELQRALELNPGYATAYQWYSNYLEFMGRVEEAIAAGQRAQQIDPLSPIITQSLGARLLTARRYDRAIEQARRALELDPAFYSARILLGYAYVHKGMYEQAITVFQQVRQRYDNPWTAAALGYAYAVSGRRGEALKVLDQLKAQTKLSSPQSLSSFCRGGPLWPPAIDGTTPWLRGTTESPPYRSCRSCAFSQPIADY